MAQERLGFAEQAVPSDGVEILEGVQTVDGHRLYPRANSAHYIANKKTPPEAGFKGVPRLQGVA
ncbi:hypothetical protein Pstr01_11660 [Pseudomonas straminea]|nr:hypothetical protein Pstr01_11660 [Pseudomonas straminea]